MLLVCLLARVKTKNILNLHTDFLHTHTPTFLFDDFDHKTRQDEPYEIQPLSTSDAPLFSSMSVSRKYCPQSSYSRGKCYF